MVTGVKTDTSETEEKNLSWAEKSVVIYMVQDLKCIVEDIWRLTRLPWYTVSRCNLQKGYISCVFQFSIDIVSVNVYGVLC